jgi:hypothetical protein
MPSESPNCWTKATWVGAGGKAHGPPTQQQQVSPPQGICLSGVFLPVSWFIGMPGIIII